MLPEPAGAVLASVTLATRTFEPSGARTASRPSRSRSGSWVVLPCEISRSRSVEPISALAEVAAEIAVSLEDVRDLKKHFDVTVDDADFARHPLTTLNDIAALLGRHPSTVRRWATCGLHGAVLDERYRFALLLHRHHDIETGLAELGNGALKSIVGDGEHTAPTVPGLRECKTKITHSL